MSVKLPQINRSVLLTAARSADELSFPAGFKFGVASAAYQVEGAWNVSDKGESIWDRFTHRHPSPIADRSTGDVACDSYHLWREDVQMIRDIGAHFYRFSISWPRLLPSGFADKVSSAGARYYSQLIDALLENNIQPVVTLYHWDLPQSLQDLGGWSNPLISEWFADYARVVYSLYADRVKTWITINEPWSVCDIPYLTGIFAPGVVSQVGAYICTKNVLLAHATAWRIYDIEFRSKYHGEVSIANNHVWMEPATETDERTAELMRQFQGGRFSHAIYSRAGGWPPALERAMAEHSKKEGHPRSLLPPLNDDEITLIRGTYDFIGLNFYTSRRVRRARRGEQLAAWPLGDAPLFRAKLDYHPDWSTIMDVYAFHPAGLRRQLAWLRRQYGDIPVLVTESGRPTAAALHDPDRIHYYREYLKQVLVSIRQDGVNVTGYTVWALMDNFEWAAGYTAGSQYGVYAVQWRRARTRSPRASARHLARIIAARSLAVLAPPAGTGAHTGTVPGAVPGTVPDTVPGTIPGTVPGTIPGTVPGTGPGTGDANFTTLY